MRFLVRIYRYQGDCSAIAPDLPGCVAAAKTVEKVKQRMAEAIEMHLDLMRQSGERIPAPSQHLDFSIDANSEQELCTWVDANVAESVSS